MPNDTIPISGTRKPDSDVGTKGEPAVAGGGQTAQQAEITGMKTGARSDADRKADWNTTGGSPGRNPAPVGGSSDGQSDRKR